MKVIVYSVNIGGYDRLPMARFPNMHMITDRETMHGMSKTYRGWNLHYFSPQPSIFRTFRRASRYYKINSHLIDHVTSRAYNAPLGHDSNIDASDISIYIDSCLDLHMDPVDIVRRYLPPNVDVAAFRHANDSTIFDHLSSLIRYKLLDSPRLACGQVHRYATDLQTENIPVTENCFLIRRNNPSVMDFNRFWWQEYMQGSARDQLSFMYAITRTKTSLHFISIPHQNARQNDIYAGWGQHRVKTKAERALH